jgi:hypothetical protein
MEADMIRARRIGRRVVAISVPIVISRRDDGLGVWCRRALAVGCAIGLTAALATIARGQSSDDSNPPGLKAEQYAQIMRAQAVLIELPQMFQRDAELEAQRAAFESALVAAMVALDPQTEQRLARLSELQTQAMAGAADQKSLLVEGRELRDALLATAAQARRQPSVAALAEPLIEALKSTVEELDSVDADTRRLVTEGDLLISVVTTMSVLSR